AARALYSLSLHDALPISGEGERRRPAGAVTLPAVLLQDRGDVGGVGHILRLARRREGNRAAVHLGLRLRHVAAGEHGVDRVLEVDRKSTRLNSSHVKISY